MKYTRDKSTASSGGSLATDTLADAKGDVFAATAADTIARVAVGSDGQVLTADAASAPGVKWATPVTGADGLGLTPTAVKTSNYTAAAGDFVPVDTTGGAVTVTLPTAPANGSIIAVKHVIQGSTNTVTIALGGSDVFNKAGGSTSGTLTLLNQAILMQYKSSGAIWYVISDDLPLSLLAQLASPTFTGTPAAPTASVDTNTTQLATTAFVIAQASGTTPIIDGSATVGSETKFARGNHIHPTDTSRAALASPTFTGTPAAPTATADTNTTQIATTAYVVATSPKLSTLTTKGDLYTTTAAGTVARLAVGSDGQVLTADAASGGGVHWAAAAGGGTAADVQEFTSSGTWTKPAGSPKATLLIVFGGGGGGGSGRKGAAGVSRCGGGGGGGAQYSYRWVPASSLGSTETVTIGAGGTAGAAQSSDSSNGNNGGTGGATTFGEHLKSTGGSGGAGGTGSTGTGGAGVAYTTSGGMWASSAGASASTTGSTGQAVPAITTLVLGGMGGGAGGGITAGDTASAGSAGGDARVSQSGNYTGGAAAGAAGTVGAGQAGGNGSNVNGEPGGGGGGGAGNKTSAAGAGGTGGYGSGGGGGGAGLDATSNSGAGGAGGSGYCVAITLY